MLFVLCMQNTSWLFLNSFGEETVQAVWGIICSEHRQKKTEEKEHDYRKGFCLLNIYLLFNCKSLWTVPSPDHLTCGWNLWLSDQGYNHTVWEHPYKMFDSHVPPPSRLLSVFQYRQSTLRSQSRLSQNCHTTVGFFDFLLLLRAFYSYLAVVHLLCVIGSGND